MLSLTTVATRLREGELASRAVETGAGNVLWLKRLSFNSSADIVLELDSVGACCELHGMRESAPCPEPAALGRLDVRNCVVSRDQSMVSLRQARLGRVSTLLGLVYVYSAAQCKQAIPLAAAKAWRGKELLSTRVSNEHLP